MSQQPIDLAKLTSQFLDALVQAEQNKDPSSLICFVSPGVYDVRPAIDTPYQRVSVSCAYATTEPVFADTAPATEADVNNAKTSKKRS